MLGNLKTDNCGRTCRTVIFKQVTVSRNELGKTVPSARILENVYRFAFTKNIRINKLKEMLWRDALEKMRNCFSMGRKVKLPGK